jgi:hypothetical protein
MVIKMETTVSIRKIIVNLIQESKDENIQAPAFREESWLNNILFSDIMDIVLFYINLQHDLEKIGKIRSDDFYRLVENVWKEWIRDKNNEVFFNLNSAWSNGPGPMDGSAGPAEMYMLYHPGLLGHKYLLAFFSYPEELPGGWSPYREHLKIMVFPKWRRENNFKNLSKIFNLAAMICNAMREKQNMGR